MELVRYTGDGDWSALFVDGLLDRVGDHYLIEERIEELVNVTVRDSNDFLLGGNSREDVAQTLAEAEEFGNRREDLRRRANELRTQAEQLLREAEAME